MAKTNSERRVAGPSHPPKQPATKAKKALKIKANVKAGGAGIESAFTSGQDTRMDSALRVR